MSDYLVRLGNNKVGRGLVSFLKLPIPLPQNLERTTGPWEKEPLSGNEILLGGNTDGAVFGQLKTILSFAGAKVIDEDGIDPEKSRPSALVMDATELNDIEDLSKIHGFFHPWIRKVAKNGRVLIIARSPQDTDDPRVAAVHTGLEGFIRSVAKEVGRKGITAQLIYLAKGAEPRLDAVVRFVLSSRSAFITGQPLLVTPIVEDNSEAKWTQPLEGKVALVTGAARGIGAETARQLAQEGARVICLDLPGDLDALKSMASSIKGEALGCDLTQENAPQVIRDYLKEHTQKIDIVVHNAGITRDRTLGKMPKDRWDLTVEVNLNAVLRLHDALEPELLQANGRIICLSSISGIAGNFGQSNYATSKSALRGWVKALAPKLASKGITVNAVAPGFIETRMTAAIPFFTREGGRRLSNLSQGGLPEDIAATITFLASPGAAGITGSTIRVCGGSFIGA